jgi:hypothetical protein
VLPIAIELVENHDSGPVQLTRLNMVSSYQPVERGAVTG